jgi:predicted TIM-barrel fold metal-dependent hydrolase
MRTIALEEHFWVPELAAKSNSRWLTGPAAMHFDEPLRDLAEMRLKAMDAEGIDLQVISHAPPAAQHLDPPEGIARAREANDRLAHAVRAHPGRFAGFATLPTSEPVAAKN